MAKPTLDSLLPGAVLDELLSAFEAAFGLSNAIAVYSVDGAFHYGTASQDACCDLWASIRVDHEEVGRAGLRVTVDNPLLPKVVNYLGTVLSHTATEHWRRHQLNEEVLARYDELNLIYGLGANFVQGMSPTEIVQNVLVETNSILQADAGAIYLWDGVRSTLSPVSFFGDNATADFWGGRVRELALSTLYAYEQAQLFDGDRIICAPLRYNEERVGALVLMYEREGKNFRADDVNLLTALTQNTALFIYAAQLVDRLARRTVELETALRELQATKDKLSQAEKLSIIGRTVGTLVHDMRKPLNNVMGYAGLLQEPNLTDEERYLFAGEINRFIKLFSDMAQEILDYIAGAQSIKKSTVRVEDYMQDVSRTLMPPGLEQPVKISVDYAAARGYEIEVDADRFKRVFQNLVNNAVDAIESKGGSFIEIHAEPENGQIRFTVTDDGPGVPAQIIPTLFQPFVTMDKAHGTGLGLAIVQQMVERHGGQIFYEPLPARGARFVFTVPVVSNGKN